MAGGEVLRPKDFQEFRVMLRRVFFCTRSKAMINCAAKAVALHAADGALTVAWHSQVGGPLPNK
jgi:hypothetical protein